MDAPSPLLLRKITQVYPQRDPAEVLAQLAVYGTVPHEQERERVQLAILKLCEETDAPDPTAFVAQAKTDYRDILAWAEYPAQMRAPAGSKGPIAHDRKQFEEWLNR